MWKLKVLIQFVLALLPAGERVNYLLQLLNRSHSPKATAERIVAYAERIKVIDEHKSLESSTVLEAGTGWEPISALLFHLMGAKTVYTYDHLPHVRFSLAQQVVKQMQENIEQIRSVTSRPSSVLVSKLSKLREATNLEELFAYAGIVYKAPGDATRSGLADNSVDLFYSYAVLEHVPESVIKGITLEAKRVLKDDGIAYHAIGLHDHYANLKVGGQLSKVNFLRYPEWLWAFFVKNKISYHNRLREKQFLDVFKSHGAKIKWIENKTDQADIEALKNMKIDKRFAGMTYEELAVHYSEVIMTFNNAL
jgi:SAM-dependent methyltransferase